MGCCLRNCYGITLDEIKSKLKDDLPLKLLEFLLDLGKCTNNRYRSNGLSNLNSLLVYAASELIKKLDEMDNNGENYDLSTSSELTNDNLSEILTSFNDIICSGYGTELSDLFDKYNSTGSESGDLVFPDGLTDEQKDAIKESLRNNNNYNDFLSGNENGSLNNTIILDGNVNGNSDLTYNYDDLFDNSGNVISNIPDSELTNLSLKERKFTCFEPEFNIDNYLFFGKNESPLLTNDRISNLKKIHNDILLPIFNHYYGNVPNACQMKIVFGLGSIKKTVETAGGSSFSKHLRGEAVDFTMVGIDSKKLINDIKNGIIKIDFGVLSATNGVHITLPFTFEDLDVRGMILSSPARSNNSLKIEFIY